MPWSKGIEDTVGIDGCTWKVRHAPPTTLIERGAQWGVFGMLLGLGALTLAARSKWPEVSLLSPDQLGWVAMYTMNMGLLCMFFLMLWRAPLQFWARFHPQTLTLRAHDVVVRGVRGPYRVVRDRRVPLDGLAIDVVSRRVWNQIGLGVHAPALVLRPRDGEAIQLWPMACTEEQAEGLVAELRAAVEAVSASEGNAEVPAALQQLIAQVVPEGGV